MVLLRLMHIMKLLQLLLTLGNFTHWEEDGVVVSYNQSYAFTAITNRTKAKTNGNVEPLITLVDVTGIRRTKFIYRSTSIYHLIMNY